MEEYGTPQKESPPLGYKSAGALTKEEEEQKELEDIEISSSVSELASYIQKCWQAAKDARETSGIDNRLYQCLRQRTGVHDPEVLAAIEEKGGGSNVYMMLTDEKCSAAESWLEDILMPADDIPFGVESTSRPELSPELSERAEQLVMQEHQNILEQQGVEPSEEVMIARQDAIMEDLKVKAYQKARKEAEKLEKEITDVLESAQWKYQFKEFLYYFVTFPVGYLKGPVLRTKPQMVWSPEGPVVEERVCKEYDVPSPFDIYPSPNARTINDGYLIEVHRLTRSDLYSLIDADAGWDEDAIREILVQHKDGMLSDWLSINENTREQLEGRGRKELDPEGKIETLQFWGDISGKKLIDWGFDEEDEGLIIEEDRDYQAEVWLINNKVIKATLNPDPIGNKPYFKASFRELYGQFYGIGLPEIIRDSQMMCNASARNLADNMAIASGPQVGVDVSLMPEGEDYEHIFPWKVWPFDLSSGMASAGGRQPVWFFYPPSLANELLAVYQHFSQEADTKSGIPRYSYGSRETGGPLSTASGFRMMMDNAARGIKKVVRNIDQGVITPTVSYLFHWLMLYEEGFAQRYKGDIKIVARGSSALATKEQKQIMLHEILSLVLSSEDLRSLAGLNGVADIFRKLLQGTDVGVDDVVPSDEQIQIMEQQRQEEMQRQQQIQEQMAMEQHQAQVGMQRSQAESMLRNTDAQQGR